MILARPFLRFALASVAAIGLGIVPLGASAAPVEIQKCDVLRGNAGGNGPGFGYGGFYPYGFYSPLAYGNGFYGSGAAITDGIQIEYRNTTTKVANRVAFGVVYRGQRNVIVDRGTFSPNVSIDHTFGEFTGLAYLGNTPNSCRVLGVHYNDGSVWRAPGMARRQSQ